MSERWKPQEEEKKQDQLKKRLFSGELSAQEFLDEIFDLDQSSASRIDAEVNIKLLEDPEVKRFLEADEGVKEEYLPHSTSKCNTLVPVGFRRSKIPEALHGTMIHLILNRS